MSKALETLSETESAKLLDALQNPPRPLHSCSVNQRNYTMAVLMLDAGLRVSEVCHLLISDLLITGQPVKALRIRAEIAKRSVERVIPCTQRIQEAVQYCRKKLWCAEWAPGEMPAFGGKNPFSHITSRQVERIIKRAGFLALDRDIHPHVLRHTFATRLMRVTNIRVVQGLLGHKHLSSTQVYTHPNGQDMKKAIESM